MLHRLPRMDALKEFRKGAEEIRVGIAGDQVLCELGGMEVLGLGGGTGVLARQHV